MVFESNKMRSPHSSVISSSARNGKLNASAQKRKPSRLTASVDNDMLGSQDNNSSRTQLTREDELWLRNALQSRLPIF
jgi:hypothetical protein